MGYAFISYSSRQQNEADALRLLLNSNGLDTWVAPYDIPEGCEYLDVVNDAIEKAACLVLLLTEDAQNSTYVDKEIERALHYGKTIAPIQLDSARLNDSFSFYLCNQQIVAVPTIDASTPKMHALIQHLHLLCNDALPPKDEAWDANRDKRRRRLKIARLITWFGTIMLAVALICGCQYIRYAQVGTYEEIYTYNPIPTLPGIARAYILFFALAIAGVLTGLYGFGLKSPKKKSWNPFKVFPMNKTLPAFSVLCFTGAALTRFAQRAVAGGIIRGLPAYPKSITGYELPVWVAPLGWAFALTGLAAALIYAAIFLNNDRKNGYAAIGKLRKKLSMFAQRVKKGGK